MNPQPDSPRKKPLVSVEWQREVDVSTGKAETRMFVKMYFGARDSGLLAALGDRRWRTLCCLATYMDQEGNCFPSQETIARDLGIARETVNRRIKELVDFRFEGAPVIRLTKSRFSGRWINNSYQILPVAGFGIFDQGAADSFEKKEDSNHVTNSSHGAVCADRHTVGRQNRHTNKNQSSTRHTRVSGSAIPGRESSPSARDLVRRFHEGAGHPSSYTPLDKELRQAADLIAEYGEELARWIVDFALQKAPETNYRPRHLGAVLSYVSDALNTRETHLASHRRREEQARADQAREDELAAERAAYAALSPEAKIERDLERWRMFFPALNRNREPTAGELEAKRHELALQHGLAISDDVSSAESLSA